MQCRFGIAVLGKGCDSILLGRHSLACGTSPLRFRCNYCLDYILTLPLALRLFCEADHNVRTRSQKLVVFRWRRIDFVSTTTEIGGCLTSSSNYNNCDICQDTKIGSTAHGHGGFLFQFVAVFAERVPNGIISGSFAAVCPPCNRGLDHMGDLAWLPVRAWFFLVWTPKDVWNPENGNGKRPFCERITRERECDVSIGNAETSETMS